MSVLDTKALLSNPLRVTSHFTRNLGINLLSNELLIPDRIIIDLLLRSFTVLIITLANYISFWRTV
tara:strand:+ start:404 stop:601 length:198 start_codon:yes stop_codon:yes gene_type:complete